MDDNKFKAVLAAAAALVLIPVISCIYGRVPAAAALSAAAIVVLIFFAVRKPNKKETGKEPEVCSDIRSISVTARGKNYVISTGADFSIEDHLQTGIMSYVENGVWKAEDNGEPGSAPVEICVPEGFAPQRLEVTAERGNVIVLIPAADSVRINTHDGETEIRSIHTGELYAEAGRGKITIGAFLSGSVQLVCGSGSIRAELENEAEEFNAEAMTGMGSIRIGSEFFGSDRRRGRIEHNAEKNIKASCGMGSIEVDFGRHDAV